MDYYAGNTVTGLWNYAQRCGTGNHHDPAKRNGHGDHLQRLGPQLRHLLVF